MNLHFPIFTSSDSELNVTYDYRCEVYRRHVRETPAGYVISEFLPDVPWAGIYNTISCAASHHFRDGRWLSDTAPLRQYAHFWCDEGNPRLYSFPLADSVLALEKVTGDTSTSSELYPRLKEIHRAWDDHKTASGLYTQLCDRDGMEFSISGDGLRPTINSYMAADTYALAHIAERLGDAESAQAYRAEADGLRTLINDCLWNPEIGMFGTLSEDGIPRIVREQVGYIPWMYGLAVEGRDACFTNLLDPDCFLAKYGLRTADVGHPDYMKEMPHSCLWNGPVWPFATSQTLTAVIEYLNTAEHPVITAEDFMTLLLQYSASHRDTDGTPWIDENMHPDTGIWLAREKLRNIPDYKLKDRGRHYNHSTFIDLVMTGLCGIRPADGNRLAVRPLGTSLDFFSATDIAYHGHRVDIAWDKCKGLKVTLDGEAEYFCEAGEDVRVEIELDAAQDAGNITE